MRNLVLVILTVIIVSCGPDNGPRKPSASGKAGELLLVMSNTKWEGVAGQMVRDVFTSYVTMLPQAEPNFNIFQIDHSTFAKLFETHRNIFFVDFDPSLEKGKIEIRKDRWAYPQVVINVVVPNEESLQRIMETNSTAFLDFYIANERERLVNAYLRMINHQARNTIRENMKLDIAVPEGYFIAKREENFVWLRQTGTRDDLELGVLITIMPYRHPDTDFSQNTIWARRDSITRRHIPGTHPNTWMTTYPEIPPVFTEINFNDLYAVEARGLWRVKDDFMGGPFVNITFVDEKFGRLINVDGFVYAPKFDKRDYMRQVEALMHSIRIFDPASQPVEEEGEPT